MKYLLFAAPQYIDTGIKPQAGYRISTNMRIGRNIGLTMPLFGSRGTAGTANTSSFNMFWISTIGPSGTTYLRADYGGAGSSTAFPINTDNIVDDKITYDVDFGKTTTINGVEYTSPTDFVGNTRNVLIGSLSDGASADSRSSYVDFADFIITDADGVEVFHGIPVPQGSTEYSATPAPSNCYWDTVSSSYKQKSGGSGVIWYEDTDDNLAEKDELVAQTADYGLKVLAEGDVDVSYMNSKYPLFGADISDENEQFKTYTFTLTGYNSEPSPSYPAYKYDSNFYYGSGRIQRTAQTIDTGFKGGKIKSILIQHNGVDNSQWQARARQYTYIDGSVTNSLLNPKSKSPPGYIQLTNSVLTLTNGETGDIPTLQGQQGSAVWNTLVEFNGGEYSQLFWEVPTVFVNIDANGILRFKTSVPYNWVQRAFNLSGYIYRARFCNWAWYQGVTVTVTVLNTPYELQ